jgi:hypothetical protein
MFVFPALFVFVSYVHVVVIVVGLLMCVLCVVL